MSATASADTLTPSGYESRLDTARAFLDQARRTSGPQRATALASARDLLARTDAISLPDGSTYAMRDVALVDAIERNEDPARIIEMLDAQSLASRSSRPVDARAARDRLREITGQYAARESSLSVIDLILQALARLLSGVDLPPLDIGRLLTIVGALGVGLIVFIVSLLGRGFRERIRRDAAIAVARTGAQSDPRQHLAAADAAIAARRSREAIHALYLYALTTLAEREVIRYDPSLTDGELLVRTAALPQARELRDLIVLYERSWFGLREPDEAEAARARTLALRVAA
jgi:hypothetical protein